MSPAMGPLSPSSVQDCISKNNVYIDIYVYICIYIYILYISVYHMMLAKMSNLMCLILSIAATLFQSSNHQG